MAGDIKKNGVAVLDDQYLLKVSKDGLRALLVPNGKERAAPDSAALKAVLTEHGVVHGLVATPKMLQDGSWLVAQGEAPVAGENAKLRFYVKPTVVRAPKIKDPAHGGTVDYRELGGIVNVEEGQLLLEKVPFSSGTPGKDVLGREIAAKPGRDVKLKLGPGVRFQEEDNRLYSELYGKFAMADEKASVFAEHIISEDVDLATGNITFKGAMLTINGAVLPGFRVRGRGDVYIAKGVNSAKILAGGNLTILGGVVGEGAELKSFGDMVLDFVENGPRLLVEGSLVLKDSAIQAEALVNGTVKALEGKGLIVGGHYVVGGSMFVKELGSDAEVVTQVSVGIKPALEKKREKLRQDQEVWPARMSETLKNINGLNAVKKESGGKLDPDKQALLEKYNAFLPKVMEKVNQLTELEEAIEKELEASANECIYVYGKLYPGVKVTIGNAVRVVSAEEEGVAIRLNKKSLQIEIKGLTEDERAMGIS